MWEQSLIAQPSIYVYTGAATLHAPARRLGSQRAKDSERCRCGNSNHRRDSPAGHQHELTLLFQLLTRIRELLR